jgi:Helix-turn-helix domain of resolvase
MKSGTPLRGPHTKLPPLGFKKLVSVLTQRALRTDMSVERLAGYPSSRHRSATLVFGWPIAAMASRTLARVILKGAPPFRPRARADASPALVRSEISSRSNSAFCGAPQNAEFERDILRQRVNAGLKAARRRGRLGGRPKSLTEADLKKARALLRSGDYTKGQVADELKVDRHTLWRALTREAAKG